MTSPSSPRLDSAVAIFEAEIANLQRANDHLQSGLHASQEECILWQGKHRDEKNEVFRLSGLSAKHVREAKQQEDRYSDLESKCADQTKENNRLQGALGKAQVSVREAELRAEAAEVALRSPNSSSSRSTTVELESLRSQVLDLEQECSHWKQMHADSNCQFAIESALKQATNTEQLLEASRLETQSCMHLGEAAEHMQEQNDIMQAKLMEAIRDLSKRETELDQLDRVFVASRKAALKAEDRVAELEAELSQWKPQPGDLDENLDALLDGLSESSSSNDPPSDYSQKHASDSPAKPSNPQPAVATCIIVNLEHSNTKHWNLFKCVQSALTKETKLDILGPQDLVADFVADMKRVQADHAEQSRAAAHWMKVANNCLAEVDALSSELRTRPACVVKGHRSMADELQAKELQLQILTQQMAQWQKQHPAVFNNP